MEPARKPMATKVATDRQPSFARRLRESQPNYCDVSADLDCAKSSSRLAKQCQVVVGESLAEIWPARRK